MSFKQHKSSASFDTAVADSPDEGGTVAQFWDPRGRRVERSEYLSRRRRIARRVQDSDSDAPVVQVDFLPHEQDKVGQRRVVSHKREAQPKRSITGSHQPQNQATLCRRCLQVRGQFEGWC